MKKEEKNIEQELMTEESRQEMEQAKKSMTPFNTVAFFVLFGLGVFGFTYGAYEAIKTAIAKRRDVPKKEMPNQEYQDSQKILSIPYSIVKKTGEVTL